MRKGGDLSQKGYGNLNTQNSKERRRTAPGKAWVRPWLERAAEPNMGAPGRTEGPRSRIQIPRFAKPCYLKVSVLDSSASRSPGAIRELLNPPPPSAGWESGSTKRFSKPF